MWSTLVNESRLLPISCRVVCCSRWGRECCGGHVRSRNLNVNELEMPFALRHDDHEYSTKRAKSGMNSISLYNSYNRYLTSVL